jgi:predicted dehydrogenase
MTALPHSKTGVQAPVRWGCLGAANIALRQVIPAMQQSRLSQFAAIASRDGKKARAAADELGIPRAYGSYEELLTDPDIEAVYNPLPNHLHVPWTIRAAEAGKHVLCEKPIALSAPEARELLAVRDRTGVQIAEAFMVRAHPRWIAIREMVRSGSIGELRSIAGHFSYFGRDRADIRNKVEWGGGALLDVGCYSTTLSRWLFDAEPMEVIAQLECDPETHVDRLASALLHFPKGQAIFTCAGQLVPYQRMQIFGTTGRIDVEIPFNAPGDYRGHVFIDDGADLRGKTIRTLEFDAFNQYEAQGDRFSEAVRGIGTVPVPLEDAIMNMAVLDALFRSGESKRWETP